MLLQKIKDNFYEKLEHTFKQFPRYHMKILLGDLNAKVGQEDIFKPIIGKWGQRVIWISDLVKNPYGTDI